MFRRRAPVAALVIGLGLAAGAQAASAQAAEITPALRPYHVLNRLAFGPTEADLAHVRAVGVDRYIDEQLAPDRIPLPPALAARLASLPTLTASPGTLWAEYRPDPAAKQDPEARKAAEERLRSVMLAAASARVLRAVDSPRQLQEVMTAFWFNHFNVFAGKGPDRFWTGSFEEQAIRPHALGRFRDLLEATARHPAMLVYLDNWQNTAPGSPGAGGKREGLNENYARELMELHTLGADGGYTQADVEALARILTGWGLAGPRKLGGDGPGFAFDSQRHDFSDKQFLGRVIHGSGAAEVETALDILAASPATAHHLGFQLAQYFVADQPDPALVDALARRYLETGGDIRQVLRALFTSPQFWDAKAFGAKFKTPYEYVLSAVRASGDAVLNPRPLLGQLDQMGMPIYRYLTPEGYKNTEAAWLNPDAMERRIAFATRLARGQMPITRPAPEAAAEPAPGLNPILMFEWHHDDAPLPIRRTAAVPEPAAPPPAGPAQPVDERRLRALLGPMLAPATLATVDAAAPALQGAMLLASPEFMHR